MPVTRLVAPLSPLQTIFQSLLPPSLVTSPNEFNFDNSFLSSFQVIATFLAFYVITAVVLNYLLNPKKKSSSSSNSSNSSKQSKNEKEVIKNGKNIKSSSSEKEESKKIEGGLLHTLFVIHNLFLSILSLTLLILMIDRLISLFSILDENLPLLQRRFLPWICSHDMAIDGPLNTLYYLNFLTKFYELLDTLFLILKGSELKFLHVYHHSMTLYLCFTQLWGGAAVQWVPITLNLTVHVLMYYYYALTSLGFKPWWKQWVTRLQIIQFILDLIACASCVGLLFTSKMSWSIGTRWALSCEGSNWAAISGISILSSYLWLFLIFYGKTYDAKKDKLKGEGDPKSKKKKSIKAT